MLDLKECSCWSLSFSFSFISGIPLRYLIFFSPLSSSTLSLLIIVLHNIVIIIIYAASCIVSICFFCSLLSRACWHKRRFFEREFFSAFSPQNPGSSKIPTVVFLQLVVQLYSSPMQQPASLFAGTHLVTPIFTTAACSTFHNTALQAFDQSTSTTASSLLAVSATHVSVYAWLLRSRPHLRRHTLVLTLLSSPQY